MSDIWRNFLALNDPERHFIIALGIFDFIMFCAIIASCCILTIEFNRFKKEAKLKAARYAMSAQCRSVPAWMFAQLTRKEPPVSNLPLITRILDKLFPWRNMPAAHCHMCRRYELKSRLVQIMWFVYVCPGTCEEDYNDRGGW